MHLFAGMYVEMIGLGYSRQPRQQGAEVNFILFILARRQMGADASAVAFHDGLKWEAASVPDSLRFLSVYLVKIGIRYNRYIEKQAKAQESSQILHDFSQKKHSKARKTLTKQGEMYINVK